MIKIFYFLFTFVILMCFYQEIAGERCDSFQIEYWRRSDPADFITNFFDVCLDGTEATPCCGHGKCNIFCHDCAGGCRRGTEKSAIRKFRRANRHISFVPTLNIEHNPHNKKKCATCLDYDKS